jgi:hypothetical protein
MLCNIQFIIHCGLPELAPPLLIKTLALFTRHSVLIKPHAIESSFTMSSVPETSPSGEILERVEQTHTITEWAPSTTELAPITWKVVVLCAYASFGGILFGYDSGYINGVLGMKQFKKDFGHAGWVDTPEAYNGYLYDSWQKSVITSILSAGTLVGSLIAGYFADRFGRRSTIIIGCVVYIVGVVLQVVAQAVPLLIVGRAVAGLGVGFVSATVIM